VRGGTLLVEVRPVQLQEQSYLPWPVIVRSRFFLPGRLARFGVAGLSSFDPETRLWHMPQLLTQEIEARWRGRVPPSARRTPLRVADVQLSVAGPSVP